MDQQEDIPAPANPLDEKIGVYVCRCGGNISDYIDTEGIAKTAGTIPGVAVSTVDTFMCSDPGQSLIVQVATTTVLFSIVAHGLTAPALTERYVSWLSGRPGQPIAGSPDAPGPAIAAKRSMWSRSSPLVVSQPATGRRSSDNRQAEQ